MRTNIDLDDELVKEAFKLSKAKTKKELVNLALKEYIKQQRAKDLMELKGKIKFKDDYNYKNLREGK